MSVSRDDVTVVIPTLNEEDGIGQIVLELKRSGYNNILIVDGYSTDGTAKVAESNGGHVVFQHGRGKCGAIETAIDHVETPFMLVMDGDCTYDPKDIAAFLAHAEKFEQIIGVRINGRKNIPRLNRFGNWFLTKTFNVLMGTKLSDVCSGMYLIRTDVARDLDLHTSGFDVEVEIAAQISSSYSVTEVPIDYRKRMGVQKLSSWKHGFQIVRTIFNLGRMYNPAVLFAGIIALAVVPASFILGWVALEMLRFGVWHSEYALTGLMLIVIASQSLTLAGISILLKRMERRFMKQLNEN